MENFVEHSFQLVEFLHSAGDLVKNQFNGYIHRLKLTDKTLHQVQDNILTYTALFSSLSTAMIYHQNIYRKNILKNNANAFHNAVKQFHDAINVVVDCVKYFAEVFNSQKTMKSKTDKIKSLGDLSHVMHLSLEKSEKFYSLIKQGGSSNSKDSNSRIYENIESIQSAVIGAGTPLPRQVLKIKGGGWVAGQQAQSYMEQVISLNELIKHSKGDKKKILQERKDSLNPNLNKAHDLQINELQDLNKEILAYIETHSNKYLSKYSEPEHFEDPVMQNARYLHEMFIIDYKILKKHLRKYFQEIDNINSNEEMQNYTASLKTHENIRKKIYEKIKSDLADYWKELELIKSQESNKAKKFEDMKKIEDAWIRLAQKLEQISEHWRYLIGPSTDPCILRVSDNLKMRLAKHVLPAIAMSRELEMPEFCNVQDAVAEFTKTSMDNMISEFI